MRWSRYLLPTLKENPADAKIVSHRLMLRAGIVRKESAGIYSYLPLGVRVLQKIEEIIAEEMDATGALKVLLPIMTHSNLWKKSGRWDQMGKEMIRIQDRHSNEFALGPTHEEVITNLVKETAFSYRDLPINLYQINTKFRDEIRPRYGVMRSREFIMKDAYSFDLDEKGLDEHYEKMRVAYRKIFGRLGLETIPVEADSGSMGGSKSEEFMILSEIGEEEIVFCKSCGYRANQEQAERAAFSAKPGVQEEKEMGKVSTPDTKTIGELVNFFDMPAESFLKTVVYNCDGTVVAAVIRGDLDINEIKLKNHLQCNNLVIASDEMVLKSLDMVPGYLGPIGLKVRMVFDSSVNSMNTIVTGSGEKDFHLVNVQSGRDFQITESMDIHLVTQGDPCPECDSPLETRPGIELGHIFKLGQKYSKSLNLSVQDENGRDLLPIMGCYGIGVNRTMAAIIEQHHDKHGIKWPVTVSPFDVGLIAIAKSEKEREIGDSVYELLKNASLEVLYDDRNLSPGIKFKDMDLVGLPIKVIVGKKTFNENRLEIKVRGTDELFDVPLDDLIGFITDLKEKLLDKIRQKS